MLRAAGQSLAGPLQALAGALFNRGRVLMQAPRTFIESTCPLIQNRFAFVEVPLPLVCNTVTTVRGLLPQVSQTVPLLSDSVAAISSLGPLPRRPNLFPRAIRRHFLRHWTIHPVHCDTRKHTRRGRTRWHVLPRAVRGVNSGHDKASADQQSRPDSPSCPTSKLTVQVRLPSPAPRKNRLARQGKAPRLTPSLCRRDRTVGASTRRQADRRRRATGR